MPSEHLLYLHFVEHILDDNKIEWVLMDANNSIVASFRNEACAKFFIASLKGTATVASRYLAIRSI